MESFSTWDSLLNYIDNHQSYNSDITFYRGQTNANWKLTPSYLRYHKTKRYEKVYYYDFVSHSGSLVPAHYNSWDILFLMQHHGIPTRLLDWTESFGVALYFALKGNPESPAIWVIDPFTLNHEAIGKEEILNPHIEICAEYCDTYLEENRIDHRLPVAVYPEKMNSRILAQKGVFTLQGQVDDPIEAVCEKFIKKISIPEKLIPDAIRFLKFAGIDEYSLFPDLDGLSRFLKERHKDKDARYQW